MGSGYKHKDSPSSTALGNRGQQLGEERIKSPALGRKVGPQKQRPTPMFTYFFCLFFFSVQRPFYITETDLLLDCFWDLPVYNYSRTEENPCVRRWRNPSVLLFEALDCYRVAGIFVQSTDNSYYPQLKSLDSECTHCTVQKTRALTVPGSPVLNHKMKIQIQYSSILDYFQGQIIYIKRMPAPDNSSRKREGRANVATGDWLAYSFSHSLFYCVILEPTSPSPQQSRHRGLLELSSLLGRRRQTHTWQMCTVRCTSRAEVPGWGTCQRVARSSWTPGQCRQTQLAGQSITRAGRRGKENRRRQVLERQPWDKPPRPASTQARRARPMARLHRGTELEARSLNIKPLPSRASLEAGNTRPEATATWQRHQAESKQWSCVGVTQNIGSCPLPPENLGKTTLGHEPSSAQRKDREPET